MDLFRSLLMTTIAAPPQLQSCHQAGQEEADCQDAEHPSKTVKLQGFAIGLRVGVAVQITAS